MQALGGGLLAHICSGANNMAAPLAAPVFAPDPMPPAGSTGPVQITWERTAPNGSKVVKVELILTWPPSGSSNSHLSETDLDGIASGGTWAYPHNVPNLVGVTGLSTVTAYYADGQTAVATANWTTT